MSFDLTNKNIQDTFQNLLQKTGSDGRLFDLEGNAVRDLVIDGTLTANTYITSQSITNTSSGSTAFGNSSDDSHTFQGNITASGNISSSGVGTFDSLDINGDATLGGNLTTTQITASGHFVGQLSPDGGGNVLKYFKSSGDASSAKIEIGDLTGDAGNNTILTIDDGNEIITVTKPLVVNGTTQAPNQELTVVGDVSGSRTGSFGHLVTNSEISIGGGVFTSASLAAAISAGDNLGNHTATQALNLDGNHIKNALNITASGDISASGGGIHHFGGAGKFQKGMVINDSGGSNSTVIEGQNDSTLFLANVNAGSPSGIDKISIGGTDFSSKLTITGDLKTTTNITASGNIIVGGDISASGDVLKTQFVEMTNSQSVVDTFTTSSFRSSKYILQVTSASNHQLSELLVLHHSGVASNTEYGQINSGLNLVNFSTDISVGGDVRLIASSSFVSCSVRYDRTLIRN